MAWRRDSSSSRAPARRTDGAVVIFARKFASQARNRQDDRSRLLAVIEKGQERQTPRGRPPTLASRARRLEEKSQTKFA